MSANFYNPAIRSDTRTLPDGRTARFADRRFGDVFAMVDGARVKLTVAEWYALPTAPVSR